MTGLQARHGRRHRARVRTPRRGRRLRLQGQRGAGRRPTATAATGATSGPCAPTTTRTWTSCRRCRSSTSTTSSGRSSPTTARSRRPSSPRAPTAPRRWPRRRCSRPGSWSPAGRYAGRCCRRPSRVEQGAVVEGSVLMNGVRVGAGAVVRNAILDKEVVVPAGCRDRRRPGDRRQARLHGRGRPDRPRQGPALPRRVREPATRRARPTPMRRILGTLVATAALAIDGRLRLVDVLDGPGPRTARPPGPITGATGPAADLADGWRGAGLDERPRCWTPRRTCGSFSQQFRAPASCPAGSRRPSSRPKQSGYLVYGAVVAVRLRPATGRGRLAGREAVTSRSSRARWPARCRSAWRR